MKPSKCEKHQNYKYMRFCPFCKVIEDRDALESRLEKSNETKAWLADRYQLALDIEIEHLNRIETLESSLTQSHARVVELDSLLQTEIIEYNELELKFNKLEASIKKWESQEDHTAMSCYISEKEMKAMKARVVELERVVAAVKDALEKCNKYCIDYSCGSMTQHALTQLSTLETSEQGEDTKGVKREEL